MKLSQDHAYELLKSPHSTIFIGKEKEYEEYVSNYLDEICDALNLPKVKRVIRQKRFDFPSFAIQPDIIVIHEDMTYSVFEVKCVNEKNPQVSGAEQVRGIGQLLLYKSVLKELNNGASPRMFLVDQKIHFRTVCVFSDEKLPITLIELNRDYMFIPYKRHVN